MKSIEFLQTGEELIKNIANAAVENKEPQLSTFQAFLKDNQELINETNDFGQNLLHIAASTFAFLQDNKGHDNEFRDVCDALFKKKIKHNTVDKSGYTPLDYCALHAPSGSGLLVKLLEFNNQFDVNFSHGNPHNTTFDKVISTPGKIDRGCHFIDLTVTLDLKYWENQEETAKEKLVENVLKKYNPRLAKYLLDKGFVADSSKREKYIDACDKKIAQKNNAVPQPQTNGSPANPGAVVAFKFPQDNKLNEPANGTPSRQLKADARFSAGAQSPTPGPTPSPSDDVKYLPSLIQNLPYLEILEELKKISQGYFSNLNDDNLRTYVVNCFLNAAKKDCVTFYGLSLDSAWVKEEQSTRVANLISQLVRIGLNINATTFFNENSLDLLTLLANQTSTEPQSSIFDIGVVQLRKKGALLKGERKKNKNPGIYRKDYSNFTSEEPGIAVSKGSSARVVKKNNEPLQIDYEQMRENLSLSLSKNKKSLEELIQEEAKYRSECEIIESVVLKRWGLSDLYKVLGFSDNYPEKLEEKDIARNFRRLALDCHPDKNDRKTKAEQKTAEEKYTEINLAKDFLINYFKVWDKKYFNVGEERDAYSFSRIYNKLLTERENLADQRKNLGNTINRIEEQLGDIARILKIEESAMASDSPEPEPTYEKNYSSLLMPNTVSTKDKEKKISTPFMSPGFKKGLLIAAGIVGTFLFVGGLAAVAVFAPATLPFAIAAATKVFGAAAVGAFSASIKALVVTAVITTAGGIMATVAGMKAIDAKLQDKAEQQQLTAHYPKKPALRDFPSNDRNDKGKKPERNPPADRSSNDYLVEDNESIASGRGPH